MTQNIDFSTTSSKVIIEVLGNRLDEIRLSRNITQAELAREAGVSRSTLTRLSDGKPVSLDSFVRVIQALGLADHLGALLSDPGVRPVDRVRFDGNKRRRASGKRSESSNWTWGDEVEGKG